MRIQPQRPGNVMTKANVFEIDNVFVVNKLNLPIVNVDMYVEKHRPSCAHLRDLDIPSVKGKQVTLLLGSDVIDIIKPIEIRSGSPG
jgi:hypothetical protein